MCPVCHVIFSGSAQKDRGPLTPCPALRWLLAPWRALARLLRTGACCASCVIPYKIVLYMKLISVKNNNKKKGVTLTAVKLHT